MLEARKENKVYRIDEREQGRYLADGFDIYDGGRVIKFSDKKVVKYQKYVDDLAKKDAIITKLQRQVNKLQAELDKLAKNQAKNDKE